MTNSIDNETPIPWNRYAGEDILGHHTDLDFMYSYWKGLNTAFNRPQRKDISPAHFRKILSQVALLDVVQTEPLDLTVRLFGTRLAEVFGELTGQSLTKLKHKDALERALSTLALVVDEKIPYINISPTLDKERAHLRIASLYAPLFNDEGDVATVLATVIVGRREIRMMVTPGSPPG